MKLVVLSACESGVVGARISNEIFGLPWVLLASGVANAVTSRWLVNGTSNSRWMHSFYTSLVDRASPAEAATIASRRMRADGNIHPYFWAAMQVSGR
jgi:CHAT domain-containing protein